MTTAEKTQTTVLNQRLTEEGFVVEEGIVETNYPTTNPNIHLDITKSDVPTLTCHVELDADENIVEGYVEILDENGERFTGRDMTLFIEEDDLESIDTLIARIVKVFS